jgi:chaperonin GroES
MLVPLRDFIVVSKDEAPKQTASGLFIAATVEEKIITGIAVAVGSGLIAGDGSIIPLEVEVGDKVIFNKSLSVEVKDGEQTFHLLREEHVLCVSRN